MHEISFTWKILSHNDINTDKYLIIGDLLNTGKILIRFFVLLNYVFFLKKIIMSFSKNIDVEKCSQWNKSWNTIGYTVRTQVLWFLFGGCNSHNIKFTLLKCAVVFKNSHKVVQPLPLFNSSEESCETTSSLSNILSLATTHLLWIYVSWTF